MSSFPNGDHLQSSSSGTAKAKKKTKKKKPGTLKQDAPSNVEVGTKLPVNGEGEEDEDQTPTESPTKEQVQKSLEVQPPSANGSRTSIPPAINQSGHDEKDMSTLTQKLDALAIERDNLRQEVAELRQSLEHIQGKHKTEVDDLKEQVEKAEEDKELAEQQHANLLERVKDIRSTLGERMKSNAEELNKASARIEELDEENIALRDANAALEETIANLHSQHAQHVKDADNLRERASLSQQNWDKEREELINREAYAREEYETARQAMQDWEVLAMEERSRREDLGEKVGQLEDQLVTLKESYERALTERENLSQTVEGLQRALREIQEERKRELRELVESSQAQLEQAQKKHQQAEETARIAQIELEKAQKELERALPFEKEVKEKNLLIGKLRHEAVGLNEHLIKALRFIKQNKPTDMVDREIISNYILHFLTFEGWDPRKFEVLKLIAANLNWDDEQREKAGLTRPGAPNIAATASSLRIPLTPFRRNPSATALNTDPSLMDQRSASKETLSELWSDFLEREAAGATSSSSSRRPSTVSGIAPEKKESPPP